MNKMIIFFTFMLFLFFINCSGEKKEEMSQMTTAKSGVVVPQNKIDLWNGKDFSGWKLFIPDPAVDVKTVWMAKDGVLHCMGIPNGYIKTQNEYSNYKLTVEWRWPGEAGNSGVLLHMSEPDTVWPKSIEAQLMSENAGDFWLIGGTDLKEHIDKSKRRIVKKEASSEKTPGEWNKYEIFCKENSIRLIVNGVLQNEGTEATVQSGKICFQSEGKPIEFRAIYLEPLP
jgi:hypothetical protein